MAQTYALARQAGFDPAAAVIMASIAMGESGLNPAAVGDRALQDEKWGPSVGLAQIRTLKADTGTGRIRDIGRLTDPLQNLVAAYEISSQGKNFSPWTVYTSGEYRDFLGQAQQASQGGGGYVPGANVVPAGLVGGTVDAIGAIAKDTGVMLGVVGLGVVLVVAGAVRATGTGGAVGGAVKLAVLRKAGK